MERSKSFANCYFDISVINEFLTELGKIYSGESKFLTLSVIENSDSWSYDKFDEFAIGYETLRPTPRTDKFSFGCSIHFLIRAEVDIEATLRFSNNSWGELSTVVGVTATDRNTISKLMAIYEKAVPSSSFTPPEVQHRIVPRIFIGHGRSTQWRDLKDHLTDKHDFNVEAYETGARAGHTIRDILDEMSKASDFAVLVMTAEDETAEGKMNPRMNVVHEVGLFQGVLGFSRAIVLLEEGCEEFSNLSGIQQIRYNLGNIKETFGDVLATIRREFEG